MRKFVVKYYIDDAEMFRGEKPHSEIWETEEVEAQSSKEAINLVMDFLINQIIQSSELSPEQDGDRINLIDNGDVVQQYYNFTVDSPIKSARLKAGLSRPEMFRKLRIPVRTIENWEANVNNTPEWAEMLVLEKLENMIEENKKAVDKTTETVV